MMFELKEYKKYFLELPKEEFSELEGALDAGLCITKRSVEGAGYKLLEKETIKKFVQKLPTICSGFKAVEQAEEKLGEKEKILDEARRGQRRSFDDYLVPENSKKSIAWGSLESGFEIYGLAVCAVGFQNSAEGTLANTCWGLGLAGFVLPLIFSISTTIAIAVMLLNDGDKDEPYIGPTGLALAGLAWLIDKKSNAREKIASARMGLAKRKQRRLGARLKKDIKQKFYSSFPYSRKWFKEEKEELLKMLGEADKNFPSSFLEVEGKLDPCDKLELYKEAARSLHENCQKIEEDMEKNTDNIQHLIDKLSLAEKASLHVGELKEKLGRGVKKTAKRFGKQAGSL